MDESKFNTTIETILNGKSFFGSMEGTVIVSGDDLSLWCEFASITRFLKKRFGEKALCEYFELSIGFSNEWDLKQL